MTTPRQKAIEALEGIEKEVLDDNKIYIQPSKYLDRINTIRAALTDREMPPEVRDALAYLRTPWVGLVSPDNPHIRTLVSEIEKIYGRGVS